MRAIILAAVVAAGIGFVGTQAASAAPANGVTIGESAAASNAVVKAHWRGPSRYRHRCHYRFRSWGRCW
jgi:hypothetical protein